MTAAAAGAFALIVAVDWAAVYRRWGRAEQVAKPLAMVALAWLALTLGAADDTTGRLVLAALVLSLAGDVLLLREGTTAFSGGLVSFLLAHLAYLLAFLTLGFRAWWALAGLLITAALSLTAGRRIVRGAADQGGAALGAGVTAYLLVISAMVITASGTGRPLVLLGAVSFLVSDTVLALDRFVGQRPHARMVVIATYHVGQLMMVIGALQ